MTSLRPIFRYRILNMTDLHGELFPLRSGRKMFGGLANQAGLILALQGDRRCKKFVRPYLQNEKYAKLFDFTLDSRFKSVVVNTGDVFELKRSNGLEARSKHSVIINTLNYLKCRYVVPGDHDLERGREFLDMIPRFKAEVLAANVLRGRLTQRFGAFVIEKIPEWKIKIAFIGLTQCPPYLQSAKLHFSEIERTMERINAAFKGRNIDIAILMLHLRRGLQRDLTDAVMGLTRPAYPVVIAGHTHFEKEGERREKEGREGLIAHGGSHGRNIAVVDLKIFPETETRIGVIKAQSRLVPVVPDWITPDPYVSGLVDQHLSLVKEDLPHLRSS